MATRVVSIAATRTAMREAQRLARSSSRLSIFVLVPMALLIIVGLGALLSASSVLALRETGDSLFYFKRQLMWLGVGILALTVAAATPLRWWRRMAFPIFTVTVLLLVAVLFVGERSYGATRWLIVGPVSIQPSELAKLSTVLFLATLVSRREGSMHRLRDFFWPVAGSLGIVAFLIVFQPDLGTTVLVAAAAFAVLAASAAPMGYVLGGALLGGSAALGLAATSPERWERIISFFQLGSDPLGSDYQAIQSLVALGTGGAFGVGLGASRARWSFLPNAHTDFIFAIIGEETGLAGSLAVIALFLTITVAGMMVAYRSSDRFGRLVAVGITTWLVTQALVNIGGVVGALPITGIPLPFLSMGGSALVTEMIGVGVLISVLREQGPTLRGTV